MAVSHDSHSKPAEVAAELPTAPVGIWDLPTRLFHWGIVASVLTAWLTGGTGERLHEAVGYVVVGLVAFRLVWGLVGTRHARFVDFVKSPFAVFRYLLDVARMRAPRHLGHNPAGGLMILVMIAALIVICATGVMMQMDAFFGIIWVEDLHGTATNVLLAMIPIHLLGVVVSSWLHQENLVGAMITGNKRVVVHKGPPADAERDRQIFDRLRGLEGMVVLVVAVAAAGGYGWMSTSGRIAVVEEAKPIVESTPTEVQRTVSKSIQDAVPVGDRQDYVAGGPAEASRTWLISAGGRLYDNWPNALGDKPPNGRHPAWPAANTSVAAADTWRCKSCHGWDYRGRGGQYAEGKSATGIVGITRMQGRNPEEIVAILADPTHRLGDDILPPHAKYRIALFVSEGQHTISRYIDGRGRALADPEHGRPIFQNICAACHGFDGKARKLGRSSDPERMGAPLYVGSKARANPVEVLHKIRNGHPGAIMVSLRPFPMSYALRVLAYAQTLPAE